MAGERVKLIGYGSFMKDILEQLGKGLLPTTWGEPVTVLGPVVVRGFQRLWSGEFYPIVVPAENRSFVGLLFEIKAVQIPRFDRIEGAPKLYHRQTVILDWNDSPTETFLYVAGKKLETMMRNSYKNRSIKPGIDDWLNHLAETLSPKATQVFPEIFSPSNIA